MTEINKNINHIDEITIIYKLIQENINENIKNKNQNNKIKIFGEEFVNNNKNNCKIIYEGKEVELKSFIEIENNKIKKGDSIEIEIKLN